MSWQPSCCSRWASTGRRCSTTTKPPAAIGIWRTSGDSLANLLANGVSPEAAAGVLGTPRWAMAAAVDALDDVYGGVDRYVRDVAGLTAAEVAALRGGLVGR